jgi:hypothetical protein
MSGTIGPLLRHPQKWPFSRSQLSSAPGPTPLGADRGSSAFSRHAQVLPQRGMAFAPEHGHQLLALGSNYAIHGVGLPGSTMAIMVPSRGPPKTGDLQGKAAESGVRALWGQQWTRLPFTPGASTATTGAWGSLQPASCVAAPRGPRRRIMAPPAGPPESRPLQGKSRRVREVRALCGPPWTRLRSREFPGALASAHSPGRARGAKKEDRSPYARDNFMRRCSDPAECRSDSAGGGHTAEAWLPQGRGELGGPKASSVGGAVMSESYRTQSWSIRTLQSGWNW